MFLLGWSIGLLAIVCCVQGSDSLSKRAAVGSGNPCNPSPCQNGGTCKLSPDPKSPICECKEITVGTYCQDLKCLDCVRYGKKVLFLFNQKPMNYADSVKKCRENNLTIFMPKDEGEFKNAQAFMQFNQGLGIGPKNKMKYAYWAGAKRNTEAVSFVWEDGEVLRQFPSWAKKTPDSGEQSCLEMFSDKFYWDNDPCRNADTGGWSYYPACTGVYPYLDVNRMMG